jgi:hypothetical protein
VGAVWLRVLNVDVSKFLWAGQGFGGGEGLDCWSRRPPAPPPAPPPARCPLRHRRPRRRPFTAARAPAGCHRPTSPLSDKVGSYPLRIILRINHSASKRGPCLQLGGCFSCSGCCSIQPAMLISRRSRSVLLLSSLGLRRSRGCRPSSHSCCRRCCCRFTPPRHRRPIRLGCCPSRRHRSGRHCSPCRRTRPPLPPPLPPLPPPS